jgi:putative Mg2+ transporter-C (MgtC) family protein
MESLDGFTQGATVGEVSARLTAALLIGGVVGWERQKMEKPAGLRTHILVSLGSATFVLLGFEVGGHIAPRYGTAGLDPTRVLQGVVGGIGFLGAGAIIKSSGHVTGMTTAASVWIAGALGAAAGLGAYIVAVIATVFTLFTLYVLPRLAALAGIPTSSNNEESPGTSESQDSIPPKPPD